MRFIARVFLPLLLLSYLGYETYLKLQDKTSCGEVGCKLAAELLNFDAMYLNYFALGGLFVLMILGIFSLKNKFYESLFFIGLYGAIAFEATIISYQFVVNPEPCLFCLSIFASLLLIALFSHIEHFAIILVTVVAIFIGMHTLAVTKNKSFISENGYYLIQSESCPHCKEVKTYLKEYNIAYTSISTQEASARSFLKFAGVTSIPVLIIKKNLDTRLITGDKPILSYFESINTPTSTGEVTSQSMIQNNPLSASSGGLSADFLSAGASDAGCAITIVEEVACEDTNKSH